MLILSIWQKIRLSLAEIQSDEHIKRDYGLIFIIFAIVAWILLAIADLCKLLNYNLYNLYEPIRISSSTFNNLFLLHAVSFFEYGPHKEYKIFNRNVSWSNLVNITFLLCIILALFLIISGISKYADGLNIFLSLITVFFLGYSLIGTFWERGMKSIAFLTFIALLIAFIIQIPYMIDLEFINPESSIVHHFLRLNYKLAFVSIIFTLELSWYLETANLPKSTKLHLAFLGLVNEKWKVQLTIPNLYVKEEFELQGHLHEVLLMLAVEKLRNCDLDGGWLHINKIGHYASLTKLTKALSIPKRNILIENDYRGNYRLRISPDNIEISKDSLSNYPKLKEILDTLS